MSHFLRNNKNARWLSVMCLLFLSLSPAYLHNLAFPLVIPSLVLQSVHSASIYRPQYILSPPPNRATWPPALCISLHISPFCQGGSRFPPANLFYKPFYLTQSNKMVQTVLEKGQCYNQKFVKKKNCHNYKVERNVPQLRLMETILESQISEKMQH